MDSEHRIMYLSWTPSSTVGTFCGPSTQHYVLFVDSDSHQSWEIEKRKVCIFFCNIHTALKRYFYHDQLRKLQLYLDLRSTVHDDATSDSMNKRIL